MRAANIPAGRMVIRDEGKPEVEIALYRMGRREPLGAVVVPRDLLVWYAHQLLGAAIVPAERAAAAADAAALGSRAVRSVGTEGNAPEGSGSA